MHSSLLFLSVSLSPLPAPFSLIGLLAGVSVYLVCTDKCTPDKWRTDNITTGGSQVSLYQAQTGMSIALLFSLVGKLYKGPVLWFTIMLATNVATILLPYCMFGISKCLHRGRDLSIDRGETGFRRCSFKALRPLLRGFKYAIVMERARTLQCLDGIALVSALVSNFKRISGLAGYRKHFVHPEVVEWHKLFGLQLRDLYAYLGIRFGDCAWHFYCHRQEVLSSFILDGLYSGLYLLAIDHWFRIFAVWSYDWGLTIYKRGKPQTAVQAPRTSDLTETVTPGVACFVVWVTSLLIIVAI
jgi:hypothetical protein